MKSLLAVLSELKTLNAQLEGAVFIIEPVQPDSTIGKLIERGGGSPHRSIRATDPSSRRVMAQRCASLWHMVRVCAAAALVASLSCLPALSASWVVEGRVVAVSDGDTITVLDPDKKQHKVRINRIDAPEKGQAFGDRSRQSLAQIAHGKDARIECHKTDRFGRAVCKVWVQPLDCPRCGKTLDVGLAQISVGLAWWFRRYADE